MLPDALSASFRALSFIALLQSSGGAIFIALFERRLDSAAARVRRQTRWAAFAAAPLLLAHYLLEAARMSDALSGVFDTSLQRMVLHSANIQILALRLTCLALIIMATWRREERSKPGNLSRAMCALSALLVTFSFTLTGHTVASPMRPVLAVLLMLHVGVVSFWFGALSPLYLVSACETSATAGNITQGFSRIATWLVPGILAAGIAMSWSLIPDLSTFTQPYGELLIVKNVGFALLLGLASLNKLRLVPAIAAGDAPSRRTFCVSLMMEYALIASTLAATAVMTEFYSPNADLDAALGSSHPNEYLQSNE